VTKELVITTLREASHVAVTPAQTAPQTLAPGVVLLPHPALQATVGLSTPRLTSRDADNVSLPSVLLDATEPLVLQGERGPGGSERIVVGGVVDRSVVTHDQPLRLTLSTALAEGEHVAAFAFDGELWLPVGGSRRPHGDAGGSNGGSSVATWSCWLPCPAGSSVMSESAVQVTPPSTLSLRTIRDSPERASGQATATCPGRRGSVAIEAIVSRSRASVVIVA